MRSWTTLKLVGALIGVVALCAACDPGWTNAVLGTGDGSGTVAGSVAVASGQVALGAPNDMVDLGKRGFLAYDGNNCTILLVDKGAATRYAGNGTCGDTGDGGPATAAEIQVNGGPFGSGLQTDSAGDVYFTTGTGNGSDASVRKIDASSGMITTLPITLPDGILLQGAAVDPDGSVVYEFYEVDGDGNGHYQIRRYEASTGDSLIATTDAASTSAGFVRVGTDHYVMFGFDSSGAERVDVDHGQVSKTPLPASPTLILCAASPTGALYGITYEDPDGIAGNQVFRLNPDNTLDFIAGSGTPDPGTARQQTHGLNLDLSAQGVALTKRGNLLIASGHAVYDLTDADTAPAEPAETTTTVPSTSSTSVAPAAPSGGATTTTSEPLRMGEPLNYFGVGWYSTAH